MFLVGLTGGIACGKSTVAQMLIQQGCHIIDADKIAYEVVVPGQSAWKKIRVHFGENVFHEDGQLKREELGRIVFTDDSKRRLLNSITHPEIHKKMRWQVLLAFLRGEQFVILDIPLLYETKKLLPFVSFVIVVNCDPETQLERLCTRNNMSTTDALNRINSQMPLSEKCSLADFVIDNSGDLTWTKDQLTAVLSTLRGSKRHWVLRGVSVVLLIGGGLLASWIGGRWIAWVYSVI